MLGMQTRLGRWGYALLALGAWWLGRLLAPMFQRAIGWEQLVTDRDWQTVLGHWVVWQGPQVLVVMLVWWVGVKVGVMPSIRSVFGSGGSWKRVATSGLMASVLLLAFTFILGAAAGGRFGWYLYLPKMAGDLVSNLYEELVHRCMLFSALYGAAAGVTFPMTREVPLSRAGLVVAALGSSIVFAGGHSQYPFALQVVMVVLSLGAWVWPWVRARSVWAPWISHTVGDVVGDTILKL